MRYKFHFLRYIWSRQTAEKLFIHPYKPFRREDYYLIRGPFYLFASCLRLWNFEPHLVILPVALPNIRIIGALEHLPWWPDDTRFNEGPPTASEFIKRNTPSNIAGVYTFFILKCCTILQNTYLFWLPEHVFWTIHSTHHCWLNPQWKTFTIVDGNL